MKRSSLGLLFAAVITAGSLNACTPKKVETDDVDAADGAGGSSSGGNGGSQGKGGAGGGTGMGGAGGAGMGGSGSGGSGGNGGAGDAATAKDTASAGGQDTSTNKDTGGGMEAGGNKDTASVTTFDTIYTTIISKKCTGCHGANGAAGLSMPDATKAKAALVGVDSVDCTGTKRVVAGDPTKSLLVTVTSMANACAKVADRMPKGGTPLTTDELASIKKWITDGAN